MSNLALKRTVKQLHEALDKEVISYSELAELDDIAEMMGIKHTDEMMAVDVLIEIENKLGV